VLTSPSRFASRTIAAIAVNAIAFANTSPDKSVAWNSALATGSTGRALSTVVDGGTMLQVGAAAAASATGDT
jgi:hypothetical protein